MIALRGCSTLVLVHRRQLLDQWRERLKSFLSIGGSEIGVIGGGQRKPTGRIDVALIQSLVRNGESATSSLTTVISSWTNATIFPHEL